jgi:PAS domain S-box-containing protein
MQDITEERTQKQELEKLVTTRTKALASSEEKLTAVINSIPDTLYYKDLDGNYQGCNYAFSAFVGMTEEEIIHKTDRDLFSEERSNEILETDRQVFENKATVVIDETVISPNGHAIYLSTIKAPYFDADGQLSGLVGISRDITNIKKVIEQERNLSKMKSQFITMASHQFKTPLTAILASTELLNMYQDQLNGTIAERINRQTQRITTEVDRLNALMNDVLILGKAETEKASVKVEETNLIEWAKKVIEDHFNHQTDGRTVEFSTSGTPKSIEIDNYMMSHVVSNLLSNAFKYSEGKANPQLHLQFNDDIVEIIVKDYGIGIPEAEKHNLFEAFFRAKNVGGIQGTGMGMVVAKEFVKLHNGNIHVNSIENEGTTVTVTLPV